MNVLSFSYCFPNASRPTWGVFVRQRLAALAARVPLRVIAPVSVFPLVTRLRGHLPPLQETQGELPVYHPRYFYLPGVLKNLDARFYERGLRRWLRSFCDQWPPDLLDAHFIWPDGVAVAHLARSLNMPFAITLRGWLYPCAEIPARRRMCAQALMQASRIISVSQALADLAIELGANPARVHVIPNGVDMNTFRPDDKEQARKELGLPLDAPLVVAVAHLKPTKGHTELVRALARVPGKPRLVIVGAQADCYGYIRTLQNEIQTLGLTDRVLLAGSQPHTRIPRYLVAADATVLASYREGCPNVVLESMACGTPVIATRVGAVPDLVEDGCSGRIVPPRDEAALSQAITDVLSRDWPIDQVRNAPGVRSWEQVAAEVLQVFDKCLGATPANVIHSRGPAHTAEKS